jgi:DNA-binding NarL/FixJ family response regulator
VRAEIMKIKILIVDDEKLIREGLKIMLSTFDDIDVIGTAENGYKALEICKSKEIDVVLMDIRMKDCDGVMGTRLIKEQFTKIKVIILTTFKDKEYIQDALKYGAFGYLLKDSSHEVIYEGIKTAYMGNMVVHPEVANEILINSNYSLNNKEIGKYDFSDKEIQIIKYIAEGLTNKEISEKLYLSEGTIKNNITNILSKLNLRDRTQIAIFAFKNRIVT